jgi:2-polyprenyl-3-methyl-5-hydroxy-6-metoxy-1,4-benzoquinol methylase
MIGNADMTSVNEYIPLRPCPLCAATSSWRIADLTYALFDDINVPSRKTLVQCRVCRLLYDDTRLNEEHLQRYYACNSHYEFVASGKLGAVKSQSAKRWDRVLDIIFAAQPSILSLLDFGCSLGNFLQRCKERGVGNAVGIEPGDIARQHALASGSKVVERLHDLAGFHPDAVTLSHVLEHLLQPRDTLEELAQVSPGALVYIEVPNAENEFSESHTDWRRLYFEHIIHFTKDTLRSFCSSCNIAIIDEGCTSDGNDDNLWILGRLPRKTVSKQYRVSFASPPYAPLPPPGGDAMSAILTRTDRISIWGVSQYAMLLIGSRIRPAGKTLHRLFDSSPAKIGRRIGGIEIEPSNRIGTLTDQHALLIPKSGFLTSMLDILPQYGFKGRVEIA